jgi:hypothetical protein
MFTPRDYELLKATAAVSCGFFLIMTALLVKVV